MKTEPNLDRQLRCRQLALDRATLGIAVTLLFLLRRHPPGSTLFPYTTLFRSSKAWAAWGSLGVVLGAAYLLWLYQRVRSEEHTSELQSLAYLVCRLLLEKKNRLALELGARRDPLPHHPARPHLLVAVTPLPTL